MNTINVDTPAPDIDWAAVAEEALNWEGEDAYNSRTIEELAEALERGYEAGTVIYRRTEDDIDFRVISL